MELASTIHTARLFVKDAVSVGSLVGEATVILQSFTQTFNQATKVPEPTTLALLGLGLFGLGFTRRRSQG